MSEPTKAQLRSLSARAATIHSKASDLFEEVERLGLNEGDRVHELAGDAMCSAAELAGALRYRAS